MSRRKSARALTLRTVGGAAAEKKGKKKASSFTKMNSCLGKRKRTEANARSNVLRRTANGEAVSAYRCSFCKLKGEPSWHVGHARSLQTQEMR